MSAVILRIKADMCVLSINTGKKKIVNNMLVTVKADNLLLSAFILLYNIDIYCVIF